MVDIAQLGFAVDSAPLQKGEQALNKLTGAAAKAEQAANGVTTSLNGASAAAGRAVGTTTGHAQAVAQHTTKLTLNTTAVKANNAALQVHTQTSKMAAMQQRNLVFQLNDVAVSLASGMNPLMVAMQQGSQISTIYGPEEGGIGRAFRETGKIITGTVARFGPLIAAVGAAAAVAAGMAYEINRVSDVTVTMGDVVTATFINIRDVIMDELAPAINFIAPYMQSAWEGAVTATKTAVNIMVRGTLIGYETIKAAMINLPNVVAAPIMGATNLVLRGIESMVNLAIRGINAVIERANSMRDMLPEAIRPGAIPNMGAVEFGRMESSAASDLSNAMSGLSSRVGEINRTDYAGRAYGAISGTATELARARAEAEKAGKAGRDAAKSIGRPWDIARGSIQAANDNVQAARGVFNSFFQDINRGIQQGERGWSILRNAAANALNSISNRMMEMASNRLFNSILGSLFGGFGGGKTALMASSISRGGSAIAGFTTGALFASGGYTGDRPRNAVAGAVHGQEFVVNAGATEKYRPMLEAMNAGRPMQAANDQPITVHVTGQLVAKDGSIVAMIDERASTVSQQVTRQGIAQYNQAVPGRMASAQRRGVG